MPTPERCRARADDAERLASLVSYGRDRERLTRQAQDWRARADELEAEAAATPPPARPAAAAPSRGLAARVRRWLRRGPGRAG